MERISVDEAKAQIQLAIGFVANLPVFEGEAAKGGQLHEEVDNLKNAVLKLLKKLGTLDDPQTAVEPLIKLFESLKDIA